MMDADTPRTSGALPSVEGVADAPDAPRGASRNGGTPQYPNLTEHWWSVASYAVSGFIYDAENLREVRGRIALLFRQLPLGAQAEIVAEAKRLTVTNCWWAKYDVGGVVLDPDKAIKEAKRRAVA